MADEEFATLRFIDQHPPLKTALLENGVEKDRVTIQQGMQFSAGRQLLQRRKNPFHGLTGNQPAHIQLLRSGTRHRRQSSDGARNSPARFPSA